MLASTSSRWVTLKGNYDVIKLPGSGWAGARLVSQHKYERRSSQVITLHNHGYSHVPLLDPCLHVATLFAPSRQWFLEILASLGTGARRDITRIRHQLILATGLTRIFSLDTAQLGGL